MKHVIKQTDAATAVTDELTTVLDWVNIEQVSGFTLVFENAGGGSGNDITDVQIDTSSDGGATVSTDQHDGTPAVPIASGTSRMAEFTETAAYIRVRAVCAAGEDTTVEAILMADSSANRICTLDDIKHRLGISDSDTDHDELLNTIIAGIEGIFDNYTRRKLIQTAADVTEYYTGDCEYLKLLRYPVISITSVKESWDYNFDDTDALTEDTDYRILNSGRTGMLFRAYGSWLKREDSIQIVYRGGYAPAGTSPAADETALPAEIREAAIEQASFLYKRKDDIGLTSVSYDGGSISKFAAIKPLPQVAQILDSYKRRTL